MAPITHSILSIDGGGIRGIIPGMILKEIETLCETPIAELFDLMAGTSTGGILATGLTVPGKDGRPKNSAEKLLNIYLGEKGKKIFQKPSIGSFFQVKLLWGSLFSPNNLEDILQEEFGDAMLSQALTNLLITSYDTQEKTPYYFQSTTAKKDDKEDFFLKEVARATSAAPTYFPPKWMAYQGVFKERQLSELSLVDGGVFANNPAVLAFVEGIQLWKGTPAYSQHFASPLEEVGDTRGMEANVKPDNFAPPILMLSLGTGQTRRPYPYAKIKNWGIQWLKPIIDILMQGVSESVHYQMQHLLPDFEEEDGTRHQRYYRLNIPIDTKYSDMSDTSNATRARLADYGKELIEQYRHDIENVCNHLLDIKEQRLG